jgi:hypothetical protein
VKIAVFDFFFANDGQAGLHKGIPINELALSMQSWTEKTHLAWLDVIWHKRPKNACKVHIDGSV